MKTKLLFTLSIFLLVICNLSAQDCQPEESECQFYYDTVLQKKVYQTASIYPVFESSDIFEFAHLILKELDKIDFAPEEVIHSHIVICFVVNEEGLLENIHSCRKKGTASRLDDEAVKIINQLKDRKWEPGRCGNKIVPILVSIPMNIRFKF